MSTADTLCVPVVSNHWQWKRWVEGYKKKVCCKCVSLLLFFTVVAVWPSLFHPLVLWIVLSSNISNCLPVVLWCGLWSLKLIRLVGFSRFLLIVNFQWCSLLGSNLLCCGLDSDLSFSLCGCLPDYTTVKSDLLIGSQVIPQYFVSSFLPIHHGPLTTSISHFSGTLLQELLVWGHPSIQAQWTSHCTTKTNT